MRYFRLATTNENDLQLQSTSCWVLLTSYLSAGFPVAFGFSVPSSITADLNIHHRPDFDSYLGGQAVLAVGYDLHRFGRNHGGILIRNSWGKQWGDSGYGWLSQAFVLSGLAADFWTAIGPSFQSPELTRPPMLREETHPIRSHSLP